MTSMKILNHCVGAGVSDGVSTGKCVGDDCGNSFVVGGGSI